MGEIPHVLLRSRSAPISVGPTHRSSCQAWLSSAPATRCSASKGDPVRTQRATRSHPRVRAPRVQRGTAFDPPSGVALSFSATGPRPRSFLAGYGNSIEPRTSAHRAEPPELKHRRRATQPRRSPQLPGQTPLGQRETQHRRRPPPDAPPPRDRPRNQPRSRHGLPGPHTAPTWRPSPPPPRGVAPPHPGAGPATRVGIAAPRPPSSLT